MIYLPVLRSLAGDVVDVLLVSGGPATIIPDARRFLGTVPLEAFTCSEAGEVPMLVPGVAHGVAGDPVIAPADRRSLTPE